MSTSSRVTVESWAPSTLAKSPHFSTWQVAARIYDEAPQADAEEKFDELSRFQLPAAILQTEDARRKDKYCSQDIFYDRLSGWAALNPESLVDEDVHDIAYFARPLFMSFFRIDHSVNTGAVELAQRRPIDDIMEIAFMGRKGSIHSIVLESRLRLPVAKQSIEVGVKAAADSLALVPFPKDLWGRITDVKEGDIDKDILDRAFWNAEGVSRSPTLPRFVGEFKRNPGNMNRNQLVMDMGTFQSQLQALSINTILWGGTYADGKFEIFSSLRRGQKTVISSHGVLTLTDPVDFLKCYSFMCNLALDTIPFLASIKSPAAKILQSMKATAWRVPGLPPTVTDTKSKAPSTIDVGTSHKHRKPDSDSDRGSGNGRTGGRRYPKRQKKAGGDVREDAEDKSGHSGAQGDGKGKGKAKACAGGSGKDDDNDLESQASGGSATISEELRIEGWMVRQGKSGRRSLQGGLLECHTFLSSVTTPTEVPFNEIEKWRSSIAV